MRTGEINAALSKQKGTTIYFYHLEVKNTSGKTIKTFAWSYQPAEVPDPSDRQFFCSVKAKPGELKGLELFTPLAPSRVVDVAKSGAKSIGDDKGKVMINQIEYTDGSEWKRPHWNSKMFPAEDRDRIAAGKCIGL